jgi:hypothetical protein
MARTASVSVMIRSLLIRSPISCVSLASPLELHNSHFEIMNLIKLGCAKKDASLNQIYVRKKTQLFLSLILVWLGWHPEVF